MLREIAAACEDRGGPQEHIVAQSGQFLTPRFDGDDQGKPIRRLIQNHGIKIDEVRHASRWGKREPITGTVIGPLCQEPAPDGDID